VNYLCCQVVGHYLLSAARVLAVGFVVYEVALDHIFSKHYSFPHQNFSTIDVATVLSCPFKDLTSSYRFACSISGNIYV